MAEEQKEAKPRKRMTATRAAASIGPLVKEFITGTIQILLLFTRLVIVELTPYPTVRLLAMYRQISAPGHSLA